MSSWLAWSGTSKFQPALTLFPTPKNRKAQGTKMRMGPPHEPPGWEMDWIQSIPEAQLQPCSRLPCILVFCFLFLFVFCFSKISSNVPSLFLILVFWVFSLLFLVSLSKSLSIFFPLKKANFSFIDFLCCLSLLCLIYFHSRFLLPVGFEFSLLFFFQYLRLGD